MISASALALDNRYLPNKWLPFTAAFASHLFLMVWDPTILRASAYQLANPVISVKMLDQLPVIEPVKPKPPPVVEKKPVEKKVVKPVKKAKKSGLSMSKKPEPVPVAAKKITPKPVAPKPYVSKVALPKFVPSSSEEPIAASPMPGVAPASSRRAVSPSIAPPALKGKSRGVRAQDIPFQLSDRGSAAGIGGHVVAIPIAEESGDIASLPSAPIIEGAPKGRKGVAGYRFAPGQGTGSGELSGRDKGGKIGYHGVVKADTYIEGSLSGGGGTGKGNKVVTGKGFEIGGPVGDRKITSRKLPQYPSWAEEQGITALVKIHFTVKADGTLRSHMRIISSSGYAELDDLAKEALKTWRFSPTSSDSSESSSWGVITFRFTLA